METKTYAIECEKVKAAKEEQLAKNKDDANILGIRFFMTNPIPACEKIDQIFGSGGETIIHYMWFEQGSKLFEELHQTLKDKTRGELLRHLVDIQPQVGWGTAKINIVHQSPPTVQILVKDSPVKTVKGSQKHLIGSFWAGVLSRYFDSQLTAKHFSYNEEKDEFSCVITT